MPSTEQVLSTVQLAGGSARPRRPVVVFGSVESILPLIGTAAAVPQAEGRLKFVTVVPPVKFVVIVKLIVVQLTLALVDTLKGTELKEEPSMRMFG